MKLLALETATDACSAALMVGGEIRVSHKVAPREHAHRIMPMCESLLADAGISLQQLDCIAFGRGPGSFTGVRIACAVAQGLAFSCDLPVVPVSTLAALAQAECEVMHCEHVLAAVDARMGEIYVGAYRWQNGIVDLMGEEQVCAVEHMLFPEKAEWYGVGSAWEAYADALAARLGKSLLGVNGSRLPEARAVAVLGAHEFEAGQAVPAERALPVYLRDKVAEKRKDRRGG